VSHPNPNPLDDLDALQDLDLDGEPWPWVEVSMDELANAVAAVDRSGDR